MVYIKKYLWEKVFFVDYVKIVELYVVHTHNATCNLSRWNNVGWVGGGVGWVMISIKISINTKTFLKKCF